MKLIKSKESELRNQKYRVEADVKQQVSYELFQRQMEKHAEEHVDLQPLRVAFPMQITF